MKSDNDASDYELNLNGIQRINSWLWNVASVDIPGTLDTQLKD